MENKYRFFLITFFEITDTDTDTDIETENENDTQIDTEISCIRIRTRGGIYGKIWPEPEGLPEGAAQGQSQGLRPYFTVYPDLSPNTDIIPFLTMIY